jgi:hypothetical protein
MLHIKIVVEVVEVDKPSRKKIVNKEKEEHHGLQF